MQSKIVETLALSGKQEFAGGIRLGNKATLGNLRKVLCAIHVVTLTLISNLATDYIQKRRGDPGFAKIDKYTEESPIASIGFF